MEAEFLDLMAETITIEPPSGTWSHGKPAGYGTAVSYQCHIDPVKGVTRVRDQMTLEEKVASYAIYVNTTTAIDPVSRITLPSGYTPQQPPILSVALRNDENGPHHTVIMI